MRMLKTLIILLISNLVFSQNPTPFSNTSDLDLILSKTIDKKLVLLGESTHGTHEFYIWRDSISRRLIQEHNFNFIAVEGDFATIYRLNQYVKGRDTISISATEILKKFNRFPRWMWANQEIAGLVEWLKNYNQNLPYEQKVGIYGIDLYDEWFSYNEVLSLIKIYSPHLYKTIKSHYDCLVNFYGNSWAYAYSVKNSQNSCENDTQKVLEIILDNYRLLSQNNDNFFYLLQNALVVSNAEKFYREEILFPNTELSWNSRVHHFYQTILNLLTLYGKDSKGIVWAHNTHIGDASFTAMKQQNQQNIGELLRKNKGKENIFSIGFTTYQGEVLAAKSWGAKMKKIQIPPAQKNSLEYRLKQTGISQFYILFDDSNTENTPIGHRGIGVVYNRKQDYLLYVPSIVSKRYDALFFFKNTSALKALD